MTLVDSLRGSVALGHLESFDTIAKLWRAWRLAESPLTSTEIDALETVIDVLRRAEVVPDRESTNGRDAQTGSGTATYNEV